MKYKVKKLNLLRIANIVWTIAGLNVLIIGVESYTKYLNLMNLLLTIVVFCIFWFMVFHKLVIKHTNRILSYREDKQYFWCFFDVKSFIIMAVMMTGGITIRIFHLLPQRFIAVFYTGLGTALFIAGLLFGYNYLKNNNNK